MTFNTFVLPIMEKIGEDGKSSPKRCWNRLHQTRGKTEQIPALPSSDGPMSWLPFLPQGLTWSVSFLGDPGCRNPYRLFFVNTLQVTYHFLPFLFSRPYLFWPGNAMQIFFLVCGARAVERQGCTNSTVPTGSGTLRETVSWPHRSAH